MVKLADIREGSIVVVRGGFGNDPPVRAVVECVEADIKNGRPGIDYRLERAPKTGSGSWAYLDQVDRVVQY